MGLVRASAGRKIAVPTPKTAQADAALFKNCLRVRDMPLMY